MCVCVCIQIPKNFLDICKYVNKLFYIQLTYVYMYNIIYYFMIILITSKFFRMGAEKVFSVTVYWNCVNLFIFQEQLECTLCILKESPVPWSQTITQLVENALKLNHPLTDMIRKEYKFISSKLIMKKYGISLKLYRTYTVSNLNNI